MKVVFDDVDGNWLRWGQLVELWARGMQSLPVNVGDLISQAEAHGVTNTTVPGLPSSALVSFYSYWPDVLTLLLPTTAQLDAGRAGVKTGPYPLPSFYDEAYIDHRRALDTAGDDVFVVQRVGEYTINYCA